MKKSSVWKSHNLKIIQMRQSGYTLQESGDSIGITRERVRQIISEQYGKIEIPLLTESRMAKEIGCPVWRLARLRRQGVLNPRPRGKYLHYYDRSELEKLKLALKRYCPHCGEPLAMNLIGRYCPKCQRDHDRRKNQVLTQRKRKTLQKG